MTTITVRAPRTPALAAAAAAAATALTLLLALATGAALGAATEVAQGVLPDALAFAANSVGAWLLAAAATAALVPRWRAGRPPGLVVHLVAGTAAMMGLLAGYYLWAALVSGTPHTAASIVWWTGAAVAGGPLAGGAAWCWRQHRPWVRAAGLAAVAVVLVAEGALDAVLHPWYRTSGLAETATGLLLPVLAEPAGGRWRPLALVAAVSGPAVGAWWVLVHLLP